MQRHRSRMGHTGHTLATIALAAKLATALLPGVGYVDALPDVLDHSNDMVEQVFDASEWRESLERTLAVSALRSIASTTLVVK